MWALVLLSTALVLNVGEGPRPDDKRAEYERLHATTDREAASQIQLALWCEENGLARERAKHLAMALLAEPDNAVARSLLGQVKVGDEWKSAEEAAAEKANDPSRVEYRDRRAKAKNTADDHSKLALWCESRGLKEEAQAHWRSVVRLDPKREMAWKKLGCKKVNGRWLTEEQIAAEKAETQAQSAANELWQGRVKDLMRRLDGKDHPQAEEAQEALLDIKDPRAIPALCQYLLDMNERHQTLAVRVFAGMDAPGATRALAGLSLLSDHDPVRKAALEALRQRDPREFAQFVIALIHKPLRYQVLPVGGPGSPGVLFVEGKQFNVRLLYAPPPAPFIPLSPFAWYGLDAEGLPTMIGMGTPYCPEALVPPQGPIAMPRVGGPLVHFNGPLGGGRAADISPHRVLEPRGIPIPIPDWFFVNPRDREKYNAFGSLGTIAQMLTPRTPGPVSDPIPAGPHLDTQTVPFGQIQREYLRSAAMAYQQQANDVAVIEQYNQLSRRVNDRARMVLSYSAGVDHGEDPDAWRVWWLDLWGYKTKAPRDYPRPTLDRNVPLAYVPRPVPLLYNQTMVANPDVLGRLTAGTGVSVRGGTVCFGAGTLVTTIDGPRPIEDLRVGDLVLAQDMSEGGLSYRPIVRTHHNPPASTLRVRLAGETIIPSALHRFWVAGRGWVMARDLNAGDPIRRLRGIAPVESIEDGEVVPVFNLDVADSATFFVGEGALLVHDNTLPDLRANPFDSLRIANDCR